MTADVRMVVLLSAIMPLLLGVLMVVYWRLRKTYPGFGHWVFGNFCIGFGFLLVGLRGRIPDFLSIILGNAFIVYGLVTIYDGFQLFFGWQAFNLWNHIVFGLYALFQLYLTYISPNPNYRIVLISGTSVLLELRVAWALFRYASPNLRHTARAIAIIFVFSSVVSLLRGIYALVQPQPIDILSDTTLAALSFASMCSITIWTFYFFFLNTARIELDLEDARENLLGVGMADHRKMIQLALLEEAIKRVSASLDEMEILQQTVEVVVDHFGYAEAAISLLVDGDELEVTAINGTEDIGYKPGFRQKMGQGIIGHTAENQLPYISGDIEHDPYYFTIGKRSGSAAGVPMLNDGHLLGVLYVETTARNAFDQNDIQTLDALVSHAVTAIQKSRLYTRVQTQLRAITTLQSVSQTILSSLDLHEIFQSVVRLLKDAFNYTYVSIYIVEGRVLRLGAQLGYPKELIYFEIPITAGVTGRTVRTKQTQFLRDVSKDADFLRADSDIESEISLPLLREDNVLGVLNVEAVRSRPLTENDMEMLNALAGTIAIAIENARLHAEVKNLAMTDGLTDLPNRRAFDLALENEISRAERYDYPLALIIVDIDSFKEFNDRFGHPAGDERLQSVAELLRSNLRSPDMVARYGGEEFALILPYTPGLGALGLAERLRAAAEASAPERSDRSSPISGYTISLGVAGYPENGRTVKELLIAADNAELEAKRLGKNRVYVVSNE